MNEEHVQLHQLVALATAAKPMLGQLRNNLEWPNSNGLPPEGATPCSDNNKIRYEAGYVEEPKGFVSEYKSRTQRPLEEHSMQETACPFHFKKPLARRVHSILSLYEDLISPDFIPYGKNLSGALERLQRAKLEFEPNEKRDQEIYVSIAKGLKPDKELNPDLKLLMIAYKDLLISGPGGREGEPSRKVGRLMDALKILVDKGIKEQGKEKVESPKGLEAELIKEWKGTDFYKDQNEWYDRRLPFQAVWKFLGEGGKDMFLSKITRQLCLEGEQGDRACHELGTRTKELANAYWDSRQAIRELWEESLGLLVRIERVERGEPSRYRALRENVVTLVVELTNVRQIASALDRLGGDGKCSVLGNVLALGLMCEVPGSDAKMEWSEANVKANPERFEAILRRALSAAPADMAHFLLDLDSLEKKAVPQDRSTVSALVEKANKDNSQRLVRLGLNRRYMDDNKQNDSQRMVQSVNEVSRNLAHWFERGRLINGIHTLTENYLKSHDSIAGDAETKDETRLLDALVEFAQKVLFLANHEGLASPPGTPGLIMGGLEKLNRSLFGDQLTDKFSPYRFFQPDLTEAQKNEYVRVLQAVGNTILFSANELHERNRYRDLSQKKVKAEVAAVNLTHSSDPKKVLDDLLEELNAEQAIVDQKVSVARARKTILEKELSGLIGTQLLVLSTKQATADAAATTAQVNLANFQSATKALKGVYQVLITEGLVNKIPQAWGTPVPSVSTVECFLKIATAGGNSCAGQWTGLAPGGRADSIEQSINREKTINRPTLTKEQQENYKEAIAYITTQEALQSAMDYRQREGRRSLKADDLLKDFIDHVRSLEKKTCGR